MSGRPVLYPMSPGNEFQTIRTMNDPTVNSPIGVRPDYNDVQCDDVMPRVGTDSEGPGLNRILKNEFKLWESQSVEP